MVRQLAAPEILADVRARLGEGPVWDARSGRLVWIDIEGAALHRTDPQNGATETFLMPLAISIAVPRTAGGYVAALEDGFWSINEDGRAERLVEIPENRARGLRFNDGGCDPAGRFWAGTMAWDFRPGAGSLYRLDADLQLTRVLDDVTISNGIGWSPDGTTMYYADTPTLRIDAFDYDLATGTASNRRPFVEVPAGGGRPDGLCVDVEGAVWLALWPGWAVHRYLPDGSLDAVIPVPVAQVSSCGFGGESLEQLFITTARVDLTDEERADQPNAGSLFRADPGVRGIPRGSFAG